MIPRPVVGHFLVAIPLRAKDAARTVTGASPCPRADAPVRPPSGSLRAAAVLVTIPTIISVLIFERRPVAGPMAGAPKD